MSDNDEQGSKEWWENYPPAPELELGWDYEFEDPEHWTENDRRRQAEVRRRWRDPSLSKEDRDKLPAQIIPPWDPIFSEGIIITFPIVPRKEGVLGR